MMASPAPKPREIISFRDTEIATEAARLSIAMDRLFAANGSFGAVVVETQASLRRLAARLEAAGYDLGGWIS